MVDLLLRSEKGSALTHNEVDGNWTAIQSAVNAGGATGVFTASEDGLAPASGGGAVNYLRSDGGWHIPAGTEGGGAAFGVNVMDYGATTTTTPGPGQPDNVAAFQAAIAAVSDLATGKGGTVYVPQGTYWFDSTLEIASSIHLIGDGGVGGNTATILYFDDGITGLRLLAWEAAPHTTYGSSGCIIESLQVAAWNKSNPDAHGIHMTSPFCRIVNVSVYFFGGDGLHIEGYAEHPADPEFPLHHYTNANCWYLDNVHSTSNAGNGMWVHGSDSNAGCATKCNFSSNTMNGVHDYSFLGNTYIGCHTAANGHWIENPALPEGYEYFYRSYLFGSEDFVEGESQVNNSTLISCYSEGDQGRVKLGPAAIGIGGLHGRGYECAYDHPDGKGQGGIVEAVGGLGVRVPGSLTVFGAVYNDTIPYQTKLIRFGGNYDNGDIIVLEWPAFSGWPTRLQVEGKDIIWQSANSPGWKAFTITGDETVYRFGRTPPTDPDSAGLAYRMYMYGAFFGAGDDARWFSSAMAVPTTGTYAAGDRVFNAAPAVGQPKGWICTVGGSPGTWVSEGTL